MSSEPKPHGRTLWDLIAEHPKQAFWAFIIVVSVIVIVGAILLTNHYNVPTPYGDIKSDISKINGMEADKSQTVEIKQTPDKIKPASSNYNKKLDTKNHTNLKQGTAKNKDKLNIEFKAPVSNSPMQIGNGNTQNNQFNGKIDRHPLEREINSILTYFPLRSREITVQYQSTDIESKNYSIELKNILNSLGYKNVKFFSHLSIGTPQQPYLVTIDTVNYNISVELNGH